jgi:DNA-binding SARP family transcriptional activator/pimeloyl-ACP methyl ester carboxylesterase
LVKLLALQPEGRLHRDAVIEALWPDASRDAAGANLRQVVKQVRDRCAAFGLSRLVASEGETLALQGRPCVDAHAFEAAALAARDPDARGEVYDRALALWAGELLPDDLYEPWTERPRAVLSALHADLMRAAAQRYSAEGRGADAVRLLERAVRDDPLDEHQWRRLMRLEADRGNWGKALRLFGELKAALSKEAGVTPARATAALAESIRREREELPVPPAPPLRYVTTDDGVRIAYWTLGSGGPPLVIMPSVPQSHAAREWRIPEMRMWYERLAQRRIVVRYDGRNTGSSTRGVELVDEHAQARDLEAVVRAMGDPRVDLYALATATAAAVTFAARHPALVRSLIVDHGHLRGHDLASDAASRIAATAITEDRSMFYEIAVRAGCGWLDDPCVTALRDMYADASDIGDTLRLFATIAKWDVTPAARRVTGPTLVLHRRGSNLTALSLSEGIVSAIPDARLALLERSAPFAFVGDVDEWCDVVEAFLAEAE